MIFGFTTNRRYPDREPVPETVLLNPSIEPLSDEEDEGWEGCLSVPACRSGKAHRAARARLCSRRGVWLRMGCLVLVRSGPGADTAARLSFRNAPGAAPADRSAAADTQLYMPAAFIRLRTRPGRGTARWYSRNG